MGFLKKNITILFFFALFIVGCAIPKLTIQESLLKNSDNDTLVINERIFFVNEFTGDSLIKKWENRINGGFNFNSFLGIDSLIFVNDLSGRIYCFNIFTGKLIGGIKLKGSVYSKPIIRNFDIIFPLINKGAETSSLVFYDLYNSKINQEVEIKDLITNEILLHKNGIVSVGKNGSIFQHDFRGNVILEINSNSRINSNPVLIKNNLFVANEFGEILIIDLGAKKIIERIKISDHPLNHLSADNHVIFVGDSNGELFSFDTQKMKIRWTFKTNSNIIMSPVIAEKFVYFGNLSGMFYALYKKTGFVKWSMQLGTLFNVSPLVAADNIFIPDLDKRLFVVDKYSGEKVNEIAIDGRLKITPYLKSNILVIGFDEAELVGYEIY